ncbi:hypothetical protein INQ28_31235, partial [Escherichia coli]|nr:hypothetical protein [Escherichia coli]
MPGAGGNGGNANWFGSGGAGGQGGTGLAGTNGVNPGSIANPNTGANGTDNSGNGNQTGGKI